MVKLWNHQLSDEKYSIKEFLVALLLATCSAASLNVTDLLFAFAFCKKINQES